MSLLRILCMHENMMLTFAFMYHYVKKRLPYIDNLFYVLE